jgi:hypothetical protein
MVYPFLVVAMMIQFYGFKMLYVQTTTKNPEGEHYQNNETPILLGLPTMKMTTSSSSSSHHPLHNKTISEDISGQVRDATMTYLGRTTAPRQQQQQQQPPNELPYLILHMGPDKTGTTTIQKFLQKHAKMLLQKDGYDATLSRGSNNRERNRLTNYFMSCFIPPKKQAGRACKPEFWEERLAKIRDIGHNSSSSASSFPGAASTTTTTTNLILSTEEFRWSTLRSRKWRDFITYLTRYFRVRVVLVYRRYFEWLPSRYNEEWKGNGPDGTKVMKWPNNNDEDGGGGGQVTPSFQSFYQWEQNGTCVHQNKLDCSVYFANRIHKATHTTTLTHPVWEMKMALVEEVPGIIEVQIVNFHTDNLLETFFCDGVPTAPAGCEKAKLVLPKVKNPSAADQIHYDTIAMAAYQRGWIAEGLARNTVKGKIREYLLLLNSNTNTTTTTARDDLPMTCMSDDLLEEYRRTSYEMEVKLQPSMAPSHDEAFWRAVAAKTFCNVDTERLLREEGWRSFFTSLRPDEAAAAALLAKQEEAVKRNKHNK